MPELNPSWAAAVAAGVNASPYFQLQSMRVVELAWGRALLELELGRKHLQPFGQAHGGVCASLVDAASFWALYTQAPEGAGLTTVEMKLNYLAPAQAGRLVGRGRAIRLGRSLGLAEASLSDQEGRLVAHGTATLMILPQLRLDGQAGLPAKFLPA
ncbi:MAG: PaaI family thioesterase [Thermodesulfobacteriota bacterium]